MPTIQFQSGDRISNRMRALLIDLAPHVVVVGSVARGCLVPKDLDLLFDFDSDIAYRRIKAIVARHDIPFESCFPGNWCWREWTMIEVLGMHYGRSYLACRRKAQQQEFWGVKLWVAPAAFCLSREQQADSIDTPE